MVTKVKSFSLVLAGLGALAAVLAVSASGAGGTFVEHDVRVLQQFDSNGPSPAGSYFGWAVSELGDVDHDGVKEAIVGEPASGADSSTGTTYVYSGRTGRLIYRFDGAAGEQNGFSIADAGDTNRDHVHDILVGSPGNGGGHVDLYSGRTGELLHRFVGAAPGDALGWSVSSAGDVDREHHADVLIGATPALDAAARRMSTPAARASGSSPSTRHRRAPSSAPSSWPASATSTATGRPISTSATTPTRRTASTQPGT